MGNKKILFVSTPCPPGKPGSNVVMKLLFDHLPKDSYRIITVNRGGELCSPEFESRVLRIGSNLRWLGRFAILGTIINTCRYYFKAKRFARKFKPDVIISPYPSFDFMLLGVLLARHFNIPYVPYLHDTMVESFAKSKQLWVAKLSQRIIFANASKLMVMSEGMVELYKKNYQLDAIAVEHIYPEPIKKELLLTEQRAKDAFWAGSIYYINDRAVKRVFDAVKRRGMKFTFTARMDRDSLSNVGVSGDCVNIESLPTRDEYIRFLSNRGIAVLALNHWDESHMGRYELATIFPTKTPEYLASGLPILVHCPDDYFLAKFFKKHQCGIVVSEQSSSALEDAIDELMSNSPRIIRMRRNALKAAELFSPEMVMQKFQKVVMQV